MTLEEDFAARLRLGAAQRAQDGPRRRGRSVDLNDRKPVTAFPFTSLRSMSTLTTDCSSNHSTDDDVTMAPADTPPGRHRQFGRRSDSPALTQRRTHSGRIGEEWNKDQQQAMALQQVQHSPSYGNASSSAQSPHGTWQQHDQRTQNQSSALMRKIYVAPYFISGYLQLFFNLMILVFCGYLLYCFYSTIRDDIDSKVQLFSEEIATQMAKCSTDFRENKCEPHLRVPAMEQLCRSWEACMQQDPMVVASRAKFSAETMGEGFNGFFEKISWKTIICLSLLMFGLLVSHNIAFYFASRQQYKPYDDHFLQANRMAMQTSLYCNQPPVMQQPYGYSAPLPLGPYGGGHQPPNVAQHQQLQPWGASVVLR